MILKYNVTDLTFIFWRGMKVREISGTNPVLFFNFEM